jgi:F-box protein 9
VAKVPHGAAADIPQLTSELQQLSVAHSAMDSQHAAVPRLLAHILESFPHDLNFEPEDERKPMHLNNIPIEMWYLIVRKLDVASIERFAHVCRRARVITLDPVYWR